MTQCFRRKTRLSSLEMNRLLVGRLEIFHLASIRNAGECNLFQA